ncbi:hypothetical protein KHA80_19015 [Anaerobacillus sp. HL2]|nr:hypothetical protein KHA80_19015 [Anaerobacillus sp. HL2]
MLRIVKQAIVLQLPLQIEKNGEMIKLLSIKLMVQNGCYYIQTNKGEVVFRKLNWLLCIH